MSYTTKMIIPLLTLYFPALVFAGIFSVKKMNQITDISQDCSGNYSTRIYLTFGNGYTDARIIQLRSISTLIRNCTLYITNPSFQKTCEKCVTIVVAEFFSYEFSNFSCTSINGGVFISEMGRFVNIWEDICHQKTGHPIYTYLIREKKFAVDLHFTNFSGLMKFIVTSAKLVGNYGNCTQDETYCILGGQVTCISKLLECDGNFNCGTPSLYDEYCTNLYIQENILFAMVYGVCLVAVIIFFFVQILRTCVPTVAEHFFEFKEGEEYKFVLTSQSLPPLELHKNFDDETVNATDTQIY